MASQMTRLIRRVERLDPELAAALEAQHRAALTNIPFGLHFERHLPESVELPGLRIRTGSKVHVLPERGYLPRGNEIAAQNARRSRLWIVKSVSGRGRQKTARIEAPCPAQSPDEEDTFEEMTVPMDNLVAVAEFHDEIYPGLKATGKVARGGDKPYHTVINAENYHALEALTYCCEGQVDCVYIDPPYNTGDKDWKYNNNYVDSDDAYRHSKWLAMIERRLKIAKRLLNPDESVLIVTIDEKEYLRLGLLLERIFPEARIQMVTSVIKPSGTPRGREFQRADEYLFFVFMGSARVTPTGSDMLNDPATDSGKKIDIWNRMLRRGTDAHRADSPNQFYPVWVAHDEARIHSIGDALPLGVDRASAVPPEEGLVPCWPIHLDGSEGRWQLGVDAARQGVADGTVKLGAYNNRRKLWSVSYLRKAEKERIARGEIEVLGKDDNGVLILRQSPIVNRVKPPLTVWNQKSHNAGSGGSNIFHALLPGRRFPFPKSLYAIEDALRFFVKDKPNALILDFFAGSGTTAHAVMRLNKQDDGTRRSILVTNNEVSAGEQKKLVEKGLRPGDSEWEKWGICEYITKPRIGTAVTGKTPDGQPVRGDYKFTDEFPMSQGFEENVEFFTLTYEDRRAVAHRMAFMSVAPLLWLKAGSKGPRIERLDGFDVTEVYGVLEDLNLQRAFVGEIRDKGARMAFIVTDDDRAFQTVCADLPSEVEKVRLYESYLTNFAINIGV